MSGKSNAVDKVKAAEDSVKLIDSESEGESVHAELNVSEELTKVKSSVETRRASKSLRKTRGSVRAAALSAELLTADTEGEMPEAGSPPLMKIKRERKEKIVDDVDVEIHNEELDIDMGEETDDADEACFKIDKVYSVAEEQDSGEPSEETGNVNESGEKKLPKLKLIADVTRKDEKKQLKEELKKLKEEKQLKAGKGGRATIAKVPSLAGGVSGVRGGVSGVRMLPGGVRAATMPLIVSMGGGNPSIPLLPAGLPPGRYVILPGTTSSATKTTTVTTMASSLSPRLASGVSSGAGPSVAVVPSKTLATPTNTPPALPHHAGGTKLYTRERGRRKSYTAGEKLAMIEAVEGGQRKSAVADRFGVAPSTLACILAQKHKIRSEQDNLARRRVRHGRGYGVRESAKTPPSAPDTPFTHFLAPLAAPSSAVLDTQPEEIIATRVLSMAAFRTKLSSAPQDEGSRVQDAASSSTEGIRGAQPSQMMVLHGDNSSSGLRPQRFRKPNYTEGEKRLIFSLLLPRLNIVENKSLDRRVVKEKYDAWQEVTTRYNAAILTSGSSLVTRDMDDLKTFWKNARRKNQWRQYMLAVPDLVERMGGGGGGGGGSKTEATSETEDEDPHPPPASPSILLETEPIIETEYLHESKSAGLHQQARRHLRHQLHGRGPHPTPRGAWWPWAGATDSRPLPGTRRTTAWY